MRQKVENLRPEGKTEFTMLVTAKSSNFPQVLESKGVEVVLLGTKSLENRPCRVGNQTAGKGLCVAVSGAWRKGPPELGIRPLSGSTAQLGSSRTAGHWLCSRERSWTLGQTIVVREKHFCSGSDSRGRRHEEGENPPSFFQPSKSHPLPCTGRP